MTLFVSPVGSAAENRGAFLGSCGTPNAVSLVVVERCLPARLHARTGRADRFRFGFLLVSSLRSTATDLLREEQVDVADTRCVGPSHCASWLDGCFRCDSRTQA